MIFEEFKKEHLYKIKCKTKTNTVAESYDKSAPFYGEQKLASTMYNEEDDILACFGMYKNKSGVLECWIALSDDMKLSELRYLKRYCKRYLKNLKSMGLRVIAIPDPDEYNTERFIRFIGFNKKEGTYAY